MQTRNGGVTPQSVLPNQQRSPLLLKGMAGSAEMRSKCRLPREPTLCGEMGPNTTHVAAKGGSLLGALGVIRN